MHSLPANPRGGARRLPLLRACLILALSLPVTGLADSALARAFDLAWQRQPAAAALGERDRAAQALQQAASAWTPAPPSLEVSARTDRFNRPRGAQEQELALALPLWLPGEQAASRTLAEAEQDSVHRNADALRLQLAQSLREAWWGWQAARNERALAEERLAAAARLRDDVERRFRAGDLSRADLNAAAGALAQAEAQAAEAAGLAAQAAFRLRSLTGEPPPEWSAPETPEPLPPVPPATHPQSRALEARLQRAEAEVELARQQTRANPVLALSTQRDRGASDEPMAQTWALSLRLPFGAGPRQEARIARARAEAIELQTETERLRERLAHEGELAAAQVDLARRQLAAAEQRAALASENRGFYDKSFRLGESDLPTRLRIEAEAFEAGRARVRARIALGQAISQWRQSLGLLPE